jgi:replication-associated recombination protein RarA
MLKVREYAHLLFVGPAGIGKTATAGVLGTSPGVDIHIGETRRRNQVCHWEPYYSYSFKSHSFVYLEDVHLQSKILQADVSYGIDLGLSVSFIVAIREEANLSPILRSRLLRFDFTPLPEEQERLKSHARQRCSDFLAKRAVQVTDSTIAEIVDTTFPNCRLMVDKLRLLELHAHSN